MKFSDLKEFINLYNYLNLGEEQRQVLMNEFERSWAEATDKEKDPTGFWDNQGEHINRQKMKSICYLKPNGEKGVLATMEKLKPGQKVLIWGGQNTDRVYPMVCDEKGVLRLPTSEAVNMDDMCAFIEDASNPKPAEPGFFQKLLNSMREFFKMGPSQAMQSYNRRVEDYQNRQVEIVKGMNLKANILPATEKAKPAPQKEEKAAEAQDLNATVTDIDENDLQADDPMFEAELEAGNGAVSAEELLIKKYDECLNQFIDKIYDLPFETEPKGLTANKLFMGRMLGQLKEPRPKALSLMMQLAELDEKGMIALRTAVLHQGLNVGEAMDNFAEDKTAANENTASLAKIVSDAPKLNK